MKDLWLTDIPAYFENRIAHCAQRREALLADARTDEANFEKIRGNVYDIFRTVYSCAVQTAGECGPEATTRFFLEKTAQISKPWRASCERAALHGDMEKQCTERLKLDTLEEIKTDVTRLWEEAI